MAKDYEAFLKVNGWNSDYKSIQNLLNYLKRKTKSEKSRVNYLQAVYYLCKFHKIPDPEALVSMPKQEIESKVQVFGDAYKERDLSIRYINALFEQLKSFFRANGFKNGNEIDIERYHQPARYRKRPEYIPTKEEIYDMEKACSAVVVKDRLRVVMAKKWKAAHLGLYGSGFRNSTFRAILYGDIKEELENPLVKTIYLRSYPEMKKLVPEACKNNIEYMTFWSSETVAAIREYVEAIKTYRKLKEYPSDAPLFSQWKNIYTPITRRDLEYIVKQLAKRAGIKQWKDVYPHCIRKSFDNTIKNSGLPEEDKEFLMGHILPGMSDTYFDKTKIEEFRAKYSRINFFANLSGEAVRKQAAKDQLRLLESLNVISKEKIEGLYQAIDQSKDVDEINWQDIISHAGRVVGRISQKLTTKQVKEYVRQREQQQANRTTSSFVLRGENDSTTEARRIRIKASELDDYLARGYDVSLELSNGDFIVKPMGE